MFNILSVVLAYTFILSDSLAHASVVKIGLSPVISSAGVILALEKGYFKKFDLEPEITPFRASTAPMTPLLAKGDLDVGAGNITAGIWNAIAEGSEIRIVADKGTVSKGHSYIGLVVRADHIKSGRYKSLKDLKGFTMAFTALNGVSQEVVAERFLKKGGVKPEDVKYLKMAYPEMTAALRNKDIDATVLLEPYIAMLENEGVVKHVAPAYEVHPNQTSAVLFFSKKFAQERRKDAVNFLAAYLLGVRDYIAAVDHGKDKLAVIEILKKHTDAVDDKVWEKMIMPGIDPNGAVNETSIVGDFEWFKSKGYITKPVKAEDWIDKTMLQDALKIVGKHGKSKR